MVRRAVDTVRQTALCALLALLALLPGCKMGLDYSGDEEGLRRESYLVEGYEDRKISYLIEGDPGGHGVCIPAIGDDQIEAVVSIAGDRSHFAGGDAR